MTVASGAIGSIKALTVVKLLVTLSASVREDFACIPIFGERSPIVEGVEELVSERQSMKTRGSASEAAVGHFDRGTLFMRILPLGGKTTQEVLRFVADESISDRSRQGQHPGLL